MCCGVLLYYGEQNDKCVVLVCGGWVREVVIYNYFITVCVLWCCNMCVLYILLCLRAARLHDGLSSNLIYHRIYNEYRLFLAFFEKTVWTDGSHLMRVSVERSLYEMLFNGVALPALGRV